MIKEIYKSVRIGSSDGYPGSFSHICNLRENRRDLLSESFGIMDYNNSKLDEIIKTFVNNDLKVVFHKNSEVEYDSMIKGFDGNTMWYKHFELEVGLGWLDKIEIFAMRGKFRDSYVIGDEFVSDSRKETMEVYYDGEWKPSYKIEGSKLNYFSVVIIYDKVTDVNDLCGIIKHEMRHGYDLFRNNFVINHINRDIIFFNDEIAKMKSGGVFLTEYWNYSLTEKKEFIRRMDYIDIYKLFCDMIYYLNIGEISSRLNNYLSDLKTTAENGKSETYRLYSGLLEIYKVLKSEVSTENKRLFSERFMKKFETVYGYDEENIEDRLRDKIGKKKFYISFKYGGKYGSESFDKLCDFFIGRLEKAFFKNADKIYSDVITKN